MNLKRCFVIMLSVLVLFAMCSCDLIGDLFGGEEPQHVHSYDAIKQECECGAINDGVVAYIGISFDKASARFFTLQDAVNYLAKKQDTKSISSENTIHGYGANISCTGITIDNIEVAFDFSASIVTFTGTNGIVINGGNVELSGQEVKGSKDTSSLITVNKGNLTTAIDFKGSVTVNKDASLAISSGTVYISEFKSDDAEAKNIVINSSSVALSTSAFEQINEHIDEKSTTTPEVYDAEEGEVVLHKEYFNSNKVKIREVDYYDDGITIKTDKHYYTNGMLNYTETYNDKGVLQSIRYNMIAVINVLRYDGELNLRLLPTSADKICYTDGLGHIMIFNLDEHGCPVSMSDGFSQDVIELKYPRNYPYVVQWGTSSSSEQFYYMNIQEDGSIIITLNNEPYAEISIDIDGNITQISFPEGDKYEMSYSEGRMTSIKETYSDERSSADTILSSFEYNKDGYLTKYNFLYYKNSQIIISRSKSLTYFDNYKTVHVEIIDNGEQRNSIFEIGDDYLLKKASYYSNGKLESCTEYNHGRSVKESHYNEGHLSYEYTYTYDSNGNRTEVEKTHFDEKGEKASSYTSVYEYNDEQKVIKESLSFFDASGKLSYRYVTEYLDYENGKESAYYEYDSNNQLTRYTIYTYDFNKFCIKGETYDDKGTLVSHSEYKKDEHGNTIEKRSFDDVNKKLSDFYKYKYTYDKYGNISSSEWISLESISVAVVPNKTVYKYGDQFDPTGMVVRLKFTDGSTEDISSYYSTNPGTFNRTGNEIPVTVSCCYRSTTINAKVESL